MNVLVTGADGFIGKNLIQELKHQNHNVYTYTRASSHQQLLLYCKEVDFVYHVAGINRPKTQEEYMLGNQELTQQLVECLKSSGNLCPVLYTSSIQASLENPYGESKKAGEHALLEYEEAGGKAYIYRLPNVFGKWSRPNYNSAIATFCHRIARNEPIQINDRSTQLELVYIDDVINDFTKHLNQPNEEKLEFYEIKPVHHVSLGDIVDFITFFKETRKNRSVPNLNDLFQKKLYSTYLSFLPEEDFNYYLKMNVDDRGSFTEFLKLSERGQVSVNVSKPGIVKGNHWHHTKNEKFLVVSGHGVIRFRKIDSEKVIEYYVSGEKLEVVDIPPGYTHNIENLGNNDMVTIMWANEYLDLHKPDTYFLEV